jgi:hypothetical protein
MYKRERERERGLPTYFLYLSEGKRELFVRASCDHLSHARTYTPHPKAHHMCMPPRMFSTEQYDAV